MIRIEFRIKKDGYVIWERSMDLVTNNLRKLLLPLLSQQSLISDLYTEKQLVDENGTVFDAYLHGETTNLFNYHLASLDNAKIALGSGLADPTMEDYALSVKKVENTLTEASLLIGAISHEVYVRTSVTIPEDFAMCEIGLFVKIKDNTGVEHWVLIARDTFHPVDVRKDDVYVLEYVYSL